MWSGRHTRLGSLILIWPNGVCIAMGANGVVDVSQIDLQGVISQGREAEMSSSSSSGKWLAATARSAKPTAS